MGTSHNWLSAMLEVDRVRLEDAVTAARRALSLAKLELRRMPGAEHEELRRAAGVVREQARAVAAYIPADWPPLPDIRCPDMARTRELIEHGRGLADRTLESAADWHRQRLERAAGDSATSAIYTRIKTSLWDWKEFASVRPGARAILETVIELARSEGFGWGTPVPAQRVRALSRLSEGAYARSVRELECLAITRPASRLRIADEHGVPAGAFTRGDLDRVPRDEPAEHAQFVARYRRGWPWNAQRASWVINYDLLCGTGRMLPCFAVEVLTLPRGYFQRNGTMGPRQVEAFGERWLAQLICAQARNGPLPDAGLRSPRWRPPEGKAK